MKTYLKALAWAGLAAAVALAAVLFLRKPPASSRVEQMKRVRGELAAREVNGSDWAAPSSKRPAAVKSEKGSAPVAADEDGEELTEEEEKLVDQIHDAMNDEDVEKAIRLARQAVVSKKTEVRSEMVDTLRWFGDKVMPELLAFVEDPDEDVRSDAMAAYQQAIYDIEEDEAKAQVVEISLRNLEDAEALDEIASELIGMDDLLAVQTLVNVIEGKCKEAGRRVARETYETVTGEEYVSFEDAEAWIREQQSE